MNKINYFWKDSPMLQSITGFVPGTNITIDDYDNHDCKGDKCKICLEVNGEQI